MFATLLPLGLRKKLPQQLDSFVGAVAAAPAVQVWRAGRAGGREGGARGRG